MKYFRYVAVLGALATLAAFTAPAYAEVVGTVTGGGFYRVIDDDDEGSPGKSKATKHGLSITGVDDDEDDDSGRAVYTEKQPGSKPTKLHLELDCVIVDDESAYASGTDRNDDRYYIYVEDGGEPGKGNDEFGIAEDSIDRALFFLLGIDCGVFDVDSETLHGGNFQVNAEE